MDESRDSETNAEHKLIQLKPVGVVRNQSKEASWGETLSTLSWQERAVRMKEQQNSVSELVIDAALDGILDGIDDFSHIMVLYWAHLIPPERRLTTRVRPMGNKDFPLVGVFATGSPVRPNSILITVVRLLEHKGNVLKVTDLDALDGSPILDIKPYTPYREKFNGVRFPDWIRQVHQEFSEDERSDSACGKVLI